MLVLVLENNENKQGKEKYPERGQNLGLSCFHLFAYGQGLVLERAKVNRTLCKVNYDSPSLSQFMNELVAFRSADCFLYNKNSMKQVIKGAIWAVILISFYLGIAWIYQA